ncbi:MAG TPA: hypothetical protein VIJ95_11755 [Hanamia sp.]
MDKNTNKKDLRLLPGYFKVIGLVVMILAFVPAAIIILMNIKILQSQKELLKVFTANAFILGLALSKDKVEDEMTIAIRLKAMAFAFISIVIYLIISPFGDFLFKIPIENLTGRHLVTVMLFEYLVMYYYLKRVR